MKALSVFFVAGLMALAACTSPEEGASSYPYQLGEFGAFYTRINSGEEFEKHARVREHADLVVDLGKDEKALVFWRGASYLPYLETPQGQWYVDEVIPRSGDGTEMMPDRTNAYSVVKLIKSSPEEVVVHWRYLPEFIGGNPQEGVDATSFVDEYFYIRPSGEVRRTIKQGTPRIDEWRDPGNKVTQSFTLTADGIKDVQTEEPSKAAKSEKVEGNPIIAQTVSAPVLWWKFDEGQGNTTGEALNNISAEVKGHKTLWRKGVSGTALQFDGYNSVIEIPASEAPQLAETVTFESWVVLGAYPWSYVPIVQQASDHPEELIAKKGGEAFLIGEEERAEFEAALEDEDEEEEFEFILKEEDDTGYFFGLDGYGRPSLKLRVGNQWEELLAEGHLERNTWYHLAGTYANGKMKLYVNGEKVAEKRVADGAIELSGDNLKIGKGKERRPIRPVRDNTFSDSYSLDGLIDELKIYDEALSDAEVAQSYQLYAVNKEAIAQVDMDRRILPAGEERDEFGAYYTHLDFYDVWDNLWRFSDHPDVVVEFDDNPSKFIFWRGVGYIPMMANEKGQWYSNEFNETWNKTGGEGCQEPMSDKESYNNHARIIENTPARAVVHWRYPLLDVRHVMANYDEETGWCDWSDWYYYIYPDGIAVKTMHLWTHGERNHEWQESMAIFGPDQHPEQIIHTKDALAMLNLEGEMVAYDWVGGPPDNVAEPEGQSIQWINYTGEYKPVTIGDFAESDVYSGEVTEYAVFPTWNHWPVAQMPSDGRYATYPDRTSHSSLTHVPPTTYKEEKGGPTPYYQKILMEGMLNWPPEELLPLARSWMHAPEISGLVGAKGKYEPGQRAYLLEKLKDEISFSVEASEESPLVNVAIVVKDWGDRSSASVRVDGKEADAKQGFVRNTDGIYKLVLWLEMEATAPVAFQIDK